MKKEKAEPKVASKKQRRYILTLCLAFVIGALTAGTGALLFRNNTPHVLVWAANKNVKVPDGLVSYLEREHAGDCRADGNAATPEDVVLFSIYESAENRMAKVSAGCGKSLIFGEQGYAFAVKASGKWKLIEPATYFEYLGDGFLDSGYDGPLSLPSCDILSEFTVPASFEPKCVKNSRYVER
jgi:hypothetical protein